MKTEKYKVLRAKAINNVKCNAGDTVELPYGMALHYLNTGTIEPLTKAPSKTTKKGEKDD